uniref:ATP synthase F0 subunit 8 n=1 Tax=Henosepilachna vigintioctopunctata TaxID=420089 RepID=A0A411DAJ3_9CUCU|nr:ATP synthase F0 subunit 8 [Henosepilachna vigintioctopunctata]QAY82219.1 ATP synthase F0 subunit 8 [Henosepilachna vigintioctopunctata]
MPQMMPLNWMMLMTQFIFIMIMINMMIYFNPMINSSSFKKKNKNSINWKW